MGHALETEQTASAQPVRVRIRWLRGVAGALLLLGAVLTLAGLAQRSEGGFFTTAPGVVATSTSALVTREIDVEARRPANPSFDVGDLGRVRIRATVDPVDAIFLGIGPTAEVERYLRNSAYDEMESYQENPLRVDFRRSLGSEVPGPPADQAFWVASAVGTGGTSLEWDKRGGAWTAVAMNADGRPGVEATVDLGLRIGFLLPTGLALLTAALLIARMSVESRGRASSN